MKMLPPKNHLSLFRRDILIPLMAAFALSLILPGLALAEPVARHLRDEVVISGHLVTLGDLLSDAGEKGHIAVFRAPEPGTTGHVSVARILAEARKHTLVSIKKPDFTKVSIKRSSRLISSDDLKNLIHDRIAQTEPLDDGTTLKINLPKRQDRHFDSTNSAPLKLTHLNHSRRNGRFTARFSLGDKVFSIFGRAARMIEMAAPRTEIDKDDYLTRDNLQTIHVRADRANNRAFATREQMVGLTARRRLPAGKPVLKRDLQAPVLVKKNQLVTILLEAPGFILRTQGKALSNAAKGESVRVLNTQSKRIIHATAKASGLVSVALKPTNLSGS